MLPAALVALHFLPLVVAAGVWVRFLQLPRPVPLLPPLRPCAVGVGGACVAVGVAVAAGVVVVVVVVVVVSSCFG